MSYNDDHPEYRIDNSVQATKRMRELVKQVKESRANCDVVFPDDAQKTTRFQRKAYREWMIRYGQALGTLVAFHQCGQLGDEAYNLLRQEVSETLVPRVVGDASHPVHLVRR